MKSVSLTHFKATSMSTNAYLSIILKEFNLPPQIFIFFPGEFTYIHFRIYIKKSFLPFFQETMYI